MTAEADGSAIGIPRLSRSCLGAAQPPAISVRWLHQPVAPTPGVLTLGQTREWLLHQLGELHGRQGNRPARRSANSRRVSNCCNAAGAGASAEVRSTSLGWRDRLPCLRRSAVRPVGRRSDPHDRCRDHRCDLSRQWHVRQARLIEACQRSWLKPVCRRPFSIPCASSRPSRNRGHQSDICCRCAAPDRGDEAPPVAPASGTPGSMRLWSWPGRHRRTPAVLEANQGAPASGTGGAAACSVGGCRHDTTSAIGLSH